VVLFGAVMLDSEQRVIVFELKERFSSVKCLGGQAIL
jgi:hypothetical protein